MKERDGDQCVITKSRPIQVAHIYPFCIIKGTIDQPGTPLFWDMLHCFWSRERVLSWKRSIFSDPNYPDQQCGSVSNQLCMQPSMHMQWSAGRCVLRPLSYNHNRTTLEVEWHWQKPVSHGPTIDVNTPVPPSRNLRQYTHPDGVADVSWDHPDYSVEAPRKIRTGDIFTLKTHNPVTHPLPSKELLDMQFVLSRIVHLAVAGEDTDLLSSDGSDCDAPAPLVLPRQLSARIEDWLSSTSYYSSEDNSTGTTLSALFPVDK